MSSHNTYNLDSLHKLILSTPTQIITGSCNLNKDIFFISTSITDSFISKTLTPQEIIDIGFSISHIKKSNIGSSIIFNRFCITWYKCIPQGHSTPVYLWKIINIF